ncbi:hypothetical protein UNPA324_31710 [Bradyrhizobium sp. UNPA324]|nr:hypothetical protein UNPA324_31710 [Bradyrhizobium sp. UNPA324]
MFAKFHVGALHGGPGRAMSDLFLPEIADMRGKGVVERLPVDVEGMRRQMVTHAGGKVFVRGIGHRPFLDCAQTG